MKKVNHTGKTVTRAGHGKSKWIFTVTTSIPKDVHLAEDAWKNSAFRITLRKTPWLQRTSDIRSDQQLRLAFSRGRDDNLVQIFTPSANKK